MALGRVTTILSKAVHNLVPSVPAETQQRGLQVGAMAEVLRIPVAKGGEVEVKATGSRQQGHNPVPHQSSPVVLEDRRMAALENWGANARRRRAS